MNKNENNSIFFYVVQVRSFFFQNSKFTMKHMVIFSASLYIFLSKMGSFIFIGLEKLFFFQIRFRSIISEILNCALNSIILDLHMVISCMRPFLTGYNKEIHIKPKIMQILFYSENEDEQDALKINLRKVFFFQKLFLLTLFF